MMPTQQYHSIRFLPDAIAGTDIGTNGAARGTLAAPTTSIDTLRPMTNDFLIQTGRCHIQIDQVQGLHISPLKCTGRLLKLHNRSPWVEVLFFTRTTNTWQDLSPTQEKKSERHHWGK